MDQTFEITELYISLSQEDKDGCPSLIGGLPGLIGQRSSEQRPLVRKEGLVSSLQPASQEVAPETGHVPPARYHLVILPPVGCPILIHRVGPGVQLCPPSGP